MKKQWVFTIFLQTSIENQWKPLDEVQIYPTETRRDPNSPTGNNKIATKCFGFRFFVFFQGRRPEFKIFKLWIFRKNSKTCLKIRKTKKNARAIAGPLGPLGRLKKNDTIYPYTTGFSQFSFKKSVLSFKNRLRIIWWIFTSFLWKSI